MYHVLPSILLINGNNWAMSQLAANKTSVAIAMARPLIFVGNISDIIIQGIGPSEKAKLAMKKEIAIINAVCDGAW